MIFKKASLSGCPVTLYHKHHKSDEYYHKHYETVNVKQVVESIKNHDKYVIDSRKENSVYTKSIEN